MIEVTDEMLKVARSMQSFELMIKRIIELHEQSKPKPEPAGYTLDVLKEYFYAGFMSSGEGFNGEWGGMKSCDTAWEEYSATQNKLQEANKPKPEPVGYIYKHRLEQMLNSEVDNDCNFFPIKDEISRVIFNRKRDKYLALYSELPTKEPLSDDDIWRIWDEGDNVSSALDFARAIEQAHGIGVK